MGGVGATSRATVTVETHSKLIASTALRSSFSISIHSWRTRSEANGIQRLRAASARLDAQSFTVVHAFADNSFGKIAAHAVSVPHNNQLDLHLPRHPRIVARRLAKCRGASSVIPVNRYDSVPSFLIVIAIAGIRIPLEIPVSPGIDPHIQRIR